MQGFTVLDYLSHVTGAFEALGRWQRDGRLVQKEDVAAGLGPGAAILIARQKQENEEMGQTCGSCNS
jgi:hypothetical protein